MSRDFKIRILVYKRIRMHSVVNVRQAAAVPMRMGCLVYGSIRLGITPSGGARAGVVLGSNAAAILKSYLIISLPETSSTRYLKMVEVRLSEPL